MTLTILIDDWLRARTNDDLATGTFADGVFHITRNERILEARKENLRVSYGRDFRAAYRLALAERLPA